VSAFGDPVIQDGAALPTVSWVIGLIGGLSTMDRLRGRAIETLVLAQEFLGAIVKGAWASTPYGPSAVSWGGGGWLDQLGTETNTDTFTFRPQPTNVQRFGATEAPRGALFHISSVGADGKLDAYQCVVPTTWNAAPHDSTGQRGPIEQAMIGLPFDAAGATFTGQGGGPITTQGGVEACRVAHSFDPCIACAVH
jgi:Ni,Fe-hydrogenase I large subunit